MHFRKQWCYCYENTHTQTRTHTCAHTYTYLHTNTHISALRNSCKVARHTGPTNTHSYTHAQRSKRMVLLISFTTDRRSSDNYTFAHIYTQRAWTGVHALLFEICIDVFNRRRPCPHSRPCINILGSYMMPRSSIQKRSFIRFACVLTFLKAYLHAFK